MREGRGLYKQVSCKAKKKRKEVGFKEKI